MEQLEQKRENLKDTIMEALEQLNTIKIENIKIVKEEAKKYGFLEIENLDKEIEETKENLKKMYSKMVGLCKFFRKHFEIKEE